MGDLFIREKFSVAIPPIEKGVDKAAEYSTEKIYDCINGELLRHNVADVEDLRLEICFMCQKCRSRFFVAGCFFTFCGGKSAVKLMISVRSQSFDKQKCTGASIITGNAASQQKFPCPIQTGQGEFLNHLAEKAIAILSVIV